MTESEANLAYIKGQASFPFKNFRTDTQEFMFAELYWLYLFKFIVNENQDSAWVARYPSSQDGNPLFSVVNWNLKRAFRVIHTYSQMEEEEIAQGIRYPALIYSSEDNNEQYGYKVFPVDGPIYELTMSCDISAESESLARKFVQLFCVNHISIRQLDQEITAYEQTAFPRST